MHSILPGLEAIPSVHPLLVHFPLALWPVALAFMAFAYLKASDDTYRFSAWLLYAGLAGGLVAAASGWFAAESLGHDRPGHDLVHDHRNFMIAALVFVALAAGATHWAGRPARRRHRWLPLGLLVVGCSLSVLGADRGGLLVYGHGFGVNSEPAPVSVVQGAGADGHDHGGHSH